jgi:hypothetical protein
MPVDIDFENHNTVVNMVKEAQDAEKDMRQAVRDAKLFITKRDGQWDPYAWKKMDGRFRGTFDMCTPIVDGIAGEIDQSDFTLRVSPSGGKASKDTAKTIDGLIRNIRNISNAEDVFQSSGRSNVIGGFDAWEVVQDWIDGDSFDQDLFIRRVPNAVDSVWFDLGSVNQDRSDSKWGVKLQAIPTAQYKERWPKGSGQSIGDDKRNNAYWEKAETVTVGQLYYRKPVSIEIVRMTDGSVYKDDEKFKSVQDELALQNITIEKDDQGKEKRRTRKSWRVHSRMFDGSEWLAKSQETVFDFIPLVPVYGNFDIVENKSIYYGKIENLYDQQRSLNYAMSRDIEDGALSPSPTVWMTDAMAEGNDYSKMNTDRAPVRTFNPDPQLPGLTPQFTGGPQPSVGLQTTIGNMQQMMGASSGMFNAQQGNAAPTQSGIAGEQQINQGNIGSIKWFKPLEVAICHTGKIIINAIPRVYDATRQVRILEEDGTSSIVTLNQRVFDEQTQTNVELNDLTIGEYDVVCDVGPAFNSQQKETAQAFLDMSAIDPTTAARNKDIWLKNLSIPGMDLAAERERAFLFKSGEIPETQWTDEEKQEVQEQKDAAAGQDAQPTPEEMIGQAEIANAETSRISAEFDQQVKQIELQQSQQKLDQEGAKLELSAQSQQIDAMFKQSKQQSDLLTDAVNQMKTITDAFGVEALGGSEPANIIEQQGNIIDDKQDQIS